MIITFGSLRALLLATFRRAITAAPKRVKGVQAIVASVKIARTFVALLRNDLRS